VNIPNEWTFKTDAIANGFDQHVREQLPWYDIATHAVAHIARHYIPEGGTVYDIGASTGNISRAIADTVKSRNASLIAIEESDAMCQKYVGPGEIVCANAVQAEIRPFDFAVLFLVVMFIPVADRRDYLQRLWRKTLPGGAMVIVDKTLAASGYSGTVMRRLPMAWKAESGESCDNIIRKELSLAGHQRPIDERILPGKPVSFFRMGEFAGWIIERGEV